MTTTAAHRIVNFSAGPSALPLEVIEEAREGMISLAGSGVGICEHSHRSKEFTKVIEEAEADLRSLMGIPDGYEVLFLTGGASQQFFQVPMNLLKGGFANYLDTGSWSSKAIKEAKRFGEVHVACSSKADNYTHIPAQVDLKPGAAYTHFTSNNTIFGTQFAAEPPAEGPLVVDASSDILSRRIDASKYGLIYAGAQKNLGPAGVTLVVIRKDLVEAGDTDLPTMLQYRIHAENKSLYNTPPVFPIYVTGLMLKWLQRQGGVDGIQKANERKADLLYGALDASSFYRAPVAAGSRSRMNVVFRLPTEELEAKMVKDALAAGFSAIKGHRSAGGIRISMYNAIPYEAVESFVSFMKEFEAANG